MSLPLMLKIVSPAFVMIGCMHLVLGLNAEVLLGAQLSLETLSNPVLDSQNRFYGVAFTCYGFLLFACASDLNRYEAIVKILLAVFFAAGCARIVSVIMVGPPTLLVQGLLLTELVLPPLVWIWLNRHLNGH